jgi:hypothetical protein
VLSQDLAALGNVSHSIVSLIARESAQHQQAWGHCFEPSTATYESTAMRGFCFKARNIEVPVSAKCPQLAAVPVGEPRGRHSKSRTEVVVTLVSGLEMIVIRWTTATRT